MHALGTTIVCIISIIACTEKFMVRFPKLALYGVAACYLELVLLFFVYVVAAGVTFGVTTVPGMACACVLGFHILLVYFVPQVLRNTGREPEMDQVIIIIAILMIVGIPITIMIIMIIII
ncbi:hypothetical protein N9L19_01145 [bacterium]|nr:hypothetical protein [bacterium]